MIIWVHPKMVPGEGELTCVMRIAPLAGVKNKQNAYSYPTLSRLRKSLRKEVIQPQVPLRLPCYDFVPVTKLAVGTLELRRLRALPASMT